MFELLGAETLLMALPAAIPLMAEGTIDGQENPFENVVSYGIHEHQRFFTATSHSYLSRPIFVNRDRFDAWPAELQEEMRAAVTDAVRLQREMHDRAEVASREIIEAAGGEIVDLTPEERAAVRANSKTFRVAASGDVVHGERASTKYVSPSSMWAAA